jgi:hypothetical protein
MGVGGLMTNGKNGVVVGTFDGAQVDLEMADAGESKSLRARRVSSMELLSLVGSLEKYDSKQRAKILSEAASRFLSPPMGLLFVLIAMACLLKSSILRRRGSFAPLFAAVLMISAETAFMTLSASIVSAEWLYYMAAGQVVLILGLWRYLRR